MKYTNRKGLSAHWITAAQEFDSEYDKAGDYSATTIADSPRIHFLKQRHEDEIIVDIADRMNMLIGSAMHAILERAGRKEPNVLTEKRIVVQVNGTNVSMKADRIEPIARTNPTQYHLKDLKTTKVGAWQYGAKESWILQGNIYRYGYWKSIQINITQITFELWLKNFNEAETCKHDYPDAEVMPVDIPVWEFAATERYLADRVKLFNSCIDLPDDKLPPCTTVERWERPERFAVMKKGGKKAISNGVKSTRAAAEEALAALKDPDGHLIEYRPGESVRCQPRHCDVCKWCNFYNTKIAPAF